MPRRPRAVLHNLLVREALRQAWLDSHPGISGGHEEVSEFIISQETIYLITLNGQVREVADTQALFAEP